MRTVVQRVRQAGVTVSGQASGQIGHGLLLLLGVEETDTAEDIQWLVNKIANLRIFNDEEGQMNQSVLEVDGEILVVSQFTLHANVKKGNRPSFIRAARPETAEALYQDFINAMGRAIGKDISTGEFGAMMQVQLVNDGPVTIIIDSKERDF